MAEEIGFENGRNLNFEGLVTLTLTLDPVIRHTVVHHSSTSTCIPNFIEIEETFCGRTYGRTYGRTFPPPPKKGRRKMAKDNVFHYPFFFSGKTEEKRENEKRLLLPLSVSIFHFSYMEMTENRKNGQLKVKMFYAVHFLLSARENGMKKNEKRKTYSAFPFPFSASCFVFQKTKMK